MSKLGPLLPKLQGALLEISIGDEYEELQLSDTNVKVNGVIFGVLRDIVEDFLIIDSYYVNKDGEVRTGNIIYINTWHVKAFTQVGTQGSLSDVFLSAAHTRKIKKLLGIDD